MRSRPNPSTSSPGRPGARTLRMGRSPAPAHRARAGASCWLGRRPGSSCCAPLPRPSRPPRAVASGGFAASGSPLTRPRLLVAWPRALRRVGFGSWGGRSRRGALALRLELVDRGSAAVRPRWRRRSAEVARLRGRRGRARTTFARYCRSVPRSYRWPCCPRRCDRPSLGRACPHLPLVPLSLAIAATRTEDADRWRRAAPATHRM